jgi:intracellular septation protein
MNGDKSAPRREPGPMARLAIDLGPLLVYFVTYFATKNVMLATGIFMVVTFGALGASWIAFRKLSLMLLFSGVMVLILGGLTLWLHDPKFVQLKPTVYYLFVASILGFGLLTDRPTIKLVLGQAYPGLSDLGWTKLTRNWTVFFVVMALLNELVRHYFSFAGWMTYKAFGTVPLTLVFALANVPMLMKHGLNAETAEDAALPPQG